MQIKLPTIDIRMRKVNVPTPDTDKARSDLDGLRGRAADFRDMAVDRASGLRDAASDRAGELRDIVGERVGDLRDSAADRATDLKDRAQEMSLPEVKLSDMKRPDLKMPDLKMPDLKMPDLKRPDVELPNIDLSNVDLGKAVAPAAKAVGDGIEAVAESFRSIGRGFDQWRKPKKQPAPLAETGVALLAGLGGGMALMFFLDPDKGRRRRSILRARLGRWTRKAGAALQGTQHQLAARSQGMSANIGSFGGSSVPPEGETQIEVMQGPDASDDLAAVDSAAGRSDDDAASAWERDSKPEIYGQHWGEPGTADAAVGGTAESDSEDQRASIGSASEG